MNSARRARWATGWATLTRCFTARVLQPYALAIAIVSAALFLSVVPEVPFGNPFWLFFPVAVILTTWFGGRGPGWLAVGLSTVAVLSYFIPPVRSIHVKPRDVPFFLTFVACELTAKWLISRRRETEETLRRARDRTGTMIHAIYAPRVGRIHRTYWEATNGQLGVAKLSDMTGGES
jgi:K+-sensing histidine kinase KdpD